MFMLALALRVMWGGRHGAELLSCWESGGSGLGPWLWLNQSVSCLESLGIPIQAMGEGVALVT